MAFGPDQIVGASVAVFFGVSRTLANQFLTRLERVGLVNQRANGRGYVPQLNTRAVEEHFQVRTVLKPIALICGAAKFQKTEMESRLTFDDLKRPHHLELQPFGPW